MDERGTRVRSRTGGACRKLDRQMKDGQGTMSIERRPRPTFLAVSSPISDERTLVGVCFDIALLTEKLRVRFVHDQPLPMTQVYRTGGKPYGERLLAEDVPQLWVYRNVRCIALGLPAVNQLASC